MGRIPDGTVIMDSWKVLSLIGEGGSGFVYLVRNVRSGKECALKVLSREAEAKYPHLRDSFLQEGELQQKIRSPHLLPVREIFPCGPDGQPCFLMKFITGITLNDRINREEPISFDYALRIAEEAASALKKIHKAGYLHLDVKPQNILIEENGKGKSYLFDLGAAQTLEQAKQENGDLRLGTPVYSSPEQCSKNGRLTEKSDLYSLGVCLYLMCAHRLPFLFGPAEEVIARVLSEEPAPPKQFNPEIPEELNGLILRMIAKDPEKRFANADEVEKTIHSLRMRLKKNRWWKLLFLLIPLAAVPLAFFLAGRQKTAVRQAEKPPIPVVRTEKKPVPEVQPPAPAVKEPSIPIEKQEPPVQVPVPAPEKTVPVQVQKTPPPEKTVPAKPPKKKAVSRKKQRPRKQVKKTPAVVKKKPAEEKKTVAAAVKPVTVTPVKPVRKEPGEETRMRLRDGRKITTAEKMTAALLLDKIAAAAQIRLRYVDCPAQVLTKSVLISLSQPVSPEQALQLVLKNIPKLHGIPGEKQTLILYYGSQPNGRFPNLAVWEQNGQILQRPKSKKEAEAALERITLNQVQVHGMPVSFVLGIFRRNTGLSVRTESLQDQKEMKFQDGNLSLRQFCRLICEKNLCQYKVEENGTILFYRRQARTFR